MDVCSERRHALRCSKARAGCRFRVEFLTPKRPGGIPNWISEMHTVKSVGGAVAHYTKGATLDATLALPFAVIIAAPTCVSAVVSKPSENRRRVVMRPCLRLTRDMVVHAGNIGVSQAAAKKLLQKQDPAQLLPLAHIWSTRRASFAKLHTRVQARTCDSVSTPDSEARRCPGWFCRLVAPVASSAQLPSTPKHATLGCLRFANCLSCLLLPPSIAVF